MDHLVKHNLDRMNTMEGFDWSAPWMVDYFGPPERFVQNPYRARVYRVYNQMARIGPDGLGGQRIILNVACEFSRCAAGVGAWVLQSDPLFGGGPGINFCESYFDNAKTKDLYAVMSGLCTTSMVRFCRLATLTPTRTGGPCGFMRSCVRYPCASAVCHADMRCRSPPSC